MTLVAKHHAPLLVSEGNLMFSFLLLSLASTVPSVWKAIFPSLDELILILQDLHQT